MTAAEGSFLGIALQSAFDTPNTNDDDFTYIMFRQGSVAAQNINLPLDPEIGGGAINPRSVVKAGVTSGGMLDLIYRPETMGWLLLGATGHVASAPNYNLTGICAGTGGSGVQPLTTSPCVLSVPTQLVATATANANGCIVTVTGKNSLNATLTETFTFGGSSAGSIAGATGSSAMFASVTSVSVDDPTTTGVIQVGFADGTYTHTYTLNHNQFDAPYYTLRFAPGNMWGEQFQDARVSGLAMQFKGAGFLEGSVQLQGRTPKAVTSEELALWNAIDQLDAGPQFLGSAPGAVMDIPLGTSAKVLSGSFVATSSIPMDEQFIIGAYEPEGVDIVSRSFAVQLNMKIDDGELYKKMQYDPNGGTEWVAALYREGNFLLKLVTGENSAVNKVTGATTSRPYSIAIKGNGQSGDNANVSWSASPIALRAQRQVVMQVNGVFHPSPNFDPITIELVNRKASYSA